MFCLNCYICSMSEFKPFIPLKSRNNIIPSDDYVVVDKDGIVKEGVYGLLLKPKYYDSRDFCKVFKDGIIAMMELSSCALKILLYLLHTMRYSDCIYLDMSKCADFTGYKNYSHIYKGLSELKKKNIIHSVSHGQYQINSGMFYKGNRLYKKDVTK